MLGHIQISIYIEKILFVHKFITEALFLTKKNTWVFNPNLIWYLLACFLLS